MCIHENADYKTFLWSLLFAVLLKATSSEKKFRQIITAGVFSLTETHTRLDKNPHL